MKLRESYVVRTVQLKLQKHFCSMSREQRLKKLEGLCCLDLEAEVERHIASRGVDCEGTVDGQDQSHHAYFGVYDGHAGREAVEYVKDHLHINLVQNSNFPRDLKTAVRQAYISTDRALMKMSSEQNPAWVSGSTVSWRAN